MELDQPRGIAIPAGDADRIAQACHDAYHSYWHSLTPEWVATDAYRVPWAAAALAAVQAYDRYLQGVADDQADQLAGVPTFQQQLQAAIDADNTARATPAGPAQRCGLQLPRDPSFQCTREDGHDGPHFYGKDETTGQDGHYSWTDKGDGGGLIPADSGSGSGSGEATPDPDVSDDVPTAPIRQGMIYG